MRFDLWSLFMQEACFTQNLKKSDGKWHQFSKEWQKWSVWRFENDYFYRWRSSVPVRARNSQKMTASGQKKVKSGTNSKVQKSGCGAQWQLQVCPSYMCRLQTKLREQSITKRTFCLYFFLMIWIRLVILEKLQKEDLWKHLRFDIVAGWSTSSQGHRNSKSALKQFFSILNQRLMTPKHAWTVSHRKSG